LWHLQNTEMKHFWLVGILSMKLKDIIKIHKWYFK